MNFSEEKIPEILSGWGLGLKRVCPEIAIAGSPERTDFRIVVEDDRAQLLILEQVALKKRVQKGRIAQTLNFLHDKGVPGIHPYLKSSGGNFLEKVAGVLWQIVPFVAGIPLDRPAYVYDGWRGPVLAEFLLDLRCASKEVPLFDPKEVFSLPQYVRELFQVIQKRRPQVASRLERHVNFFDRSLFAVYDKLPVAFCHGDYHPVNIIWGEGKINAVIDWEFVGHKPELYDVANMLGCLGVEDPESLGGSLVLNFLEALRSGGYCSLLSQQHLVELVAAIRFGWMSEWLRKKDEEMVELEGDYLELLLDNRAALQRTWGIKGL